MLNWSDYFSLDWPDYLSLDWSDYLDQDWSVYFKGVVGLLSIVNPIGNMPVFLSLTQARKDNERYAIALSASITLSIVLLISLIAGEAILNFFSIGIPSFRVAGGILILMIALSMLRAEPSESRQLSDQTVDPDHQDAVGIVPLGIPLLGGPGTISTVIVYAQAQESLQQYFLISMAIMSVVLITLAILLMAPTLASVMGKTGMTVTTRITGLIITAIAVEFIAKGLKELLPGLA